MISRTGRGSLTSSLCRMGYPLFRRLEARQGDSITVYGGNLAHRSLLGKSVAIICIFLVTLIFLAIYMR